MVGAFLQLHCPRLTRQLHNQVCSCIPASTHPSISTAMSFGFAVGDFVAVGKLVHDITDCLQATSSAKEEYQELVRELQLLNAALHHLDRLSNSTESSTTVDSIKCAALSCRYPLGNFLAEIKKYDTSLGVQSQLSLMQSAKRKTQWTFVTKDDVERLQRYLNMHIGTINVLLAQHSLESIKDAEETTRNSNEQVRTQLNTTQGFLSTISNNASAQVLMLRNVLCSPW